MFYLGHIECKSFAVVFPFSFNVSARCTQKTLKTSTITNQQLISVSTTINYHMQFEDNLNFIKTKIKPLAKQKQNRNVLSFSVLNQIS